jgi:hypothetical protein
MKQIKNVVGAVSGDTLVKVIIPSSPFLGQEAMVPVSAIGGGESGQWIPTVIGTSGNPTVEVIAGNYSRVGDVVTCSLFLGVTLAPENFVSFRLSIPVASSFIQEKNAFGIIACNGGAPEQLVNWNIKASVGNDDIEIEVLSLTDEYTFEYLYAILQYVII